VSIEATAVAAMGSLSRVPDLQGFSRSPKQLAGTRERQSDSQLVTSWLSLCQHSWLSLETRNFGGKGGPSRPETCLPLRRPLDTHSLFHGEPFSSHRPSMLRMSLCQNSWLSLETRNFGGGGGSVETRNLSVSQALTPVSHPMGWRLVT